MEEGSIAVVPTLSPQEIHRGWPRTWRRRKVPFAFRRCQDHTPQVLPHVGPAVTGLPLLFVNFVGAGVRQRFM